MLITLEGGEYVGKTTNAELLVENLNAAGIKSKFFRAPAGTEICDCIRSILKGGFSKSEQPVSSTEILLFLAATTQMDYKLIKPAIQDGYVCVCDRWIDSTFVYQVLYRQSISEQLLRLIQKELMDVTIPDVTFILDASMEEIMRRKKKRDIGFNGDDYDNMGEPFFKFLKQSYLNLAKFKRNYHVIDADKPFDDIQHQIALQLALTDNSMFVDLWKHVTRKTDE